MKRLLLPLILAVVSCSPRVIYQTEVRDSIRVQERVIRDSIPFEIVREVEKVVTRDTSSHLENTYGVSDAVVSGGFLFHSLETKPQRIYVPYEVTVHDTLTVHEYLERGTEIKEVERDFTWWEQTQMKGFRILFLLVCAYGFSKWLKIKVQI